MKLPMLARTLAICAVAALILVPIALIGGKISERQARARAVVTQFAQETSGPQLLVGPLLALTCEDAATGAACPTAYFAPRDFKATASMPVETRHRGIYPIRLYRADVALSGEWQWPKPPSPEGRATRAWKHARIVAFVQDPRGIKAGRFPLNEDLGPYAGHAPGARVPFQYRMTLVGTTSLRIAPVGEQNDITLTSDWPHPAFAEAYSPDERSISRDGFQATWRIGGAATGGAEAWSKLAAEGKLAASPGAGVSLFDPVNVYALSYRATEYAFLFVLFTFAALALTEAVAGIRLHPMQYLLVGAALAVFFLLLLALSEHIAFRMAYAAAATACAALLAFYLRHPLGTLPRTAGFLALFAGLYGSLYTLLQSEDHALLLGSLMVFAALAVVMIATRKLDWSGFGKVRPSP